MKQALRRLSTHQPGEFLIILSHFNNYFSCVVFTLNNIFIIIEKGKKSSYLCLLKKSVHFIYVSPIALVRVFCSKYSIIDITYLLMFFTQVLFQHPQYVQPVKALSKQAKSCWDRVMEITNVTSAPSMNANQALTLNSAFELALLQMALELFTDPASACDTLEVRALLSLPKNATVSKYCFFPFLF